MTAAHAIETTELAELERVISDGLRTFVEVGRALAKIRDGKLYQGEGFKSFEAYCRERWDFTRMRAHQLIQAAEVSENVKHVLHDEAPANPRQAAELAKLPAGEQPRAWQEAVATAPEGKVTAKHVAAVVAKIKGEESASSPSSKVTPEDVARAREAMKRFERDAAPRFPEEPRPNPLMWWTCPSCESSFNLESAAGHGWVKRGFCGHCEDEEVVETEDVNAPDPEPKSAVSRINNPPELAIELGAELDILREQRLADPEFANWIAIQSELQKKIPSRPMRMALFVLQGGEFALLRLGLDWSVTHEKLRQAYRDAARAAHPDRGGSQNEFVKLGEYRRQIEEMLGTESEG